MPQACTLAIHQLDSEQVVRSLQKSGFSGVSSTSLRPWQKRRSHPITIVWISEDEAPMLSIVTAEGRGAVALNPGENLICVSRAGGAEANGFHRWRKVRISSVEIGK